MANAFTDRTAPEPSPGQIADALGPAADAWESLLRAIADAGGAVAWKWYRDGGWLARAAKGTKTLLWADIDDEGFVDGSFYFAARLREAVASMPGIAPDSADSILASELWGSTVAIPFELRTPADVEALQPFFAAKLTLK